MDSKVCVVCNIEKCIDNFYKKYRDCKLCNIQRSMNVTMRIIIIYQIKEKNFMKK